MFLYLILITLPFNVGIERVITGLYQMEISQRWYLGIVEFDSLRPYTQSEALFRIL